MENTGITLPIKDTVIFISTSEFEDKKQIKLGLHKGMYQRITRKSKSEASAFV